MVVFDVTSPHRLPFVKECDNSAGDRDPFHSVLSYARTIQTTFTKNQPTWIKAKTFKLVFSKNFHIKYKLNKKYL